MKNLSIILLFVLFTSCQKDEIIALTPTETKEINEVIEEAKMDAKTLYSGDFITGAHTTSGKAKVIEEKDKSLSLIFENFKTDAGPDLRIYLAEDTQAKNFIEITNTVKNGNTIYTIPTTADLTKQKYVLIWCKQFSVLFGSSQLKD